MRRILLSLSIVAFIAVLADVTLAPLFLAERLDRAIALLLASGIFTIAIAAVVER
jgi:hypothetical protein